MSNTQRQANENFKEYKIRLYRNQAMYGLTNDAVGDLLNADTGNDWSESAYRKHAHPYIEGWDDAIKAGISDDVALSELDKKMDELYKQQVKTRDKHRELRSSLRDEARIENLQDVFVECANIISKERPLALNTYPTYAGERIAIAQFSDWHFDEIVNNFMNTYNHDVFNDRINKLTTDIIRYCKLMDATTLKILNLGDLMSGNLHVSSRVMADEDIVYQTMYVAEAVANMLTEFAKEINLVEFCSVLDNHSRTNKNKKEHIEKESFARFIPWFLEPRLANIRNIKIVKNRINEIEEFNIGLIDIFHEKAFFVHGHEDKVSSVISDLTLMTKIFPIAVFIGHLHQNMEMEVHSIDLIMNPSLIGTGEYAKSIRKSSKSRQKLTIYENNNGSVERVSTFFINL